MFTSTCTTIIITLEPCAINVEFQHSMLRLNKNFLTLQIPLEEGMEVKAGRPKDRVILPITLVSLPNTQKQQGTL